MTDVWSSALHVASFGGVSFDCLATSDSISRAIVRHSYPRRPGADLQDMGSEALEVRCQILFWERERQEGDTDSGNHLARYAAFRKAVLAGKAQAFVHPILGTITAMVENFSSDSTGDERDVTRVECTFVEDSTQPARFATNSSALLDPFGRGAKTMAELSAAAMLAMDLDAQVALDAAAMIDAWDANPDLSLREVNLQLASATAAIDAAVVSARLDTDIEAFPTLRLLNGLTYSLKSAATLFRQRQPQEMTSTVATATPLRVLVTEIYGAGQADQGYSDAMRMNDIDDPSLIPAGTVLKLPAPKRARVVDHRRSA